MNIKALKGLFWGCIIIAIVVSGYLFKDLADVSQWIIQSERTTTMWVHFNRDWMAALTLITFVIALLIRIKNKDVASNKVFGGLTLLIAFQFFSGYINPHLMMRERQFDGVFLPIDEARQYVEADTSMIVYDINGQARAHSDLHLLRPHIAGNGEFAGENVVMTYCGLTNLGMAVTPEIDGQPLNLRPMTQLNNNLVMVDRNTDQPIQQLWMQKEDDYLASSTSRMKEWPTFRMPFEKFAQAYPDGEVFINDYLVHDLRSKNPVVYAYDKMMDLIFDHGIEDQAGKEAPTFPTVEYTDKRLASKEQVWGLNVGTDYVAYTPEFIKQNGNLINTVIGGEQIVIAYDTEFDSVGFFYNVTGEDVSDVNFYGQSNGTTLPRVESVKAGAYWIVWSHFFPNTEVNRV